MVLKQLRCQTDITIHCGIQYGAVFGIDVSHTIGF
jgi:hypothetical protein